MPSSRDCSEEEEEEPSPSQYQVERVRADGADGIEEDEPPDMVSESEDDEDPTNDSTKHLQSRPTAADQIYSKVLNKSRNFIAQMEDALRQSANPLTADPRRWLRLRKRAWATTDFRQASQLAQPHPRN